MLRLLIGIAAFFWLGVVIAEVIRQSELLGAIGSPFLWGICTALLYGASEYIQNRIHRTAQRTGTQSGRMVTGYQVFLAGICLIFFATIPFLWWGVIKELARLPQ